MKDKWNEKDGGRRPTPAVVLPDKTDQMKNRHKARISKGPAEQLCFEVNAFLLFFLILLINSTT